MLKIQKRSKKTLARRGILSTAHGALATPFFMPIATYGAVKGVDTEDLRKHLNSPILLSNTYHLWMRPGLKILKKFRGLHQLMDWQRPILTDSGGYQVFSLSKMRTFTDQGIVFQNPVNGTEHLLTPESAIQIQSVIGSDIMMALDVCPAYPCTFQEAALAVRQTSRWARRCVKEKQRTKNKKQLLFGIIQGSIYKDLRVQSAKDICSLGFDGIAIGGVAVGEPRKYFMKAVRDSMPYIPEHTPRYLMGLGKPEEIVAAVNEGIDMFDCVIPTRNARHGLLYIASRKDFYSNSYIVKGSTFYKTLTLSRALFQGDKKPIDPYCHCYTCQRYSRAYLHHLYRTKETQVYRLLSLHNLYFYLRLMQNIRRGI